MQCNSRLFEYLQPIKLKTWSGCIMDGDFLQATRSSLRNQEKPRTKSKQASEMKETPTNFKGS